MQHRWGTRITLMTSGLLLAGAPVALIAAPASADHSVEHTSQELMTNSGSGADTALGVAAGVGALAAGSALIIAARRKQS